MTGVQTCALPIWSAPELFNLDADGHATQIGGAPPDAFAPECQKWGNPTYRWDRMRADRYTWWIARLKRSLSLYDRLRLDHFLGFQSFFSIPADGGAENGRWLPGPGIELFQDRKSTRLNSSHRSLSRMPSSA